MAVKKPKFAVGARVKWMAKGKILAVGPVTSYPHSGSRYQISVEESFDAKIKKQLYWVDVAKLASA